MPIVGFLKPLCLCQLKHRAQHNTPFRFLILVLPGAIEATVSAAVLANTRRPTPMKHSQSMLHHTWLSIIYCNIHYQYLIYDSS